MTPAQPLPTTKATYLDQLRDRLKGMPDSEVITATAYYDEYLTEAGPENEAAAIAELGSPAQVASGIMGDYVYADTTGQDKTARKGLSAIWIVVIGLIASPIALPLAIALIAVIFALLITVLSAIFSLFMAAAGLIVAGIVYLAVGFFTLFSSFASGLVTIGVGLVGTALGAAMMLGLVWATRHAVNGIASLGARFLQRRQARKGAVAGAENGASS